MISILGLIAQILSLVFVLKKNTYKRETKERLQYAHYTLLAGATALVFSLINGNCVTAILNVVILAITNRELDW